MCKSHCDSTPVQPAAPAAPAAQEPAWVEKLGGIIFPAAFIAFLAGIVLAILSATGRPVHFNPDTVWILKVYATILLLGFFTYLAGTVWNRGLRRDMRVLKTAIRWLILDRKVRSTSLRLVSIQDELELAQDNYWWGARESGREAELSREIVRLREYRDALRTELDRLMAELREARPDRFN